MEPEEVSQYVINCMTHINAEQYFERRELDISNYKNESIDVSSLEADRVDDSKLIGLTKFLLARRAIERGLEYVTDMDTRINEGVVLIDATGWRKKR